MQQNVEVSKSDDDDEEPESERLCLTPTLQDLL